MLIKKLIKIYDDDYMYGRTIDYWILSSNIDLELPKPECLGNIHKRRRKLMVSTENIVDMPNSGYAE